MKDRQKGLPSDSGRGAKITTERKPPFRLTAKPEARLTPHASPALAPPLVSGSLLTPTFSSAEPSAGAAAPEASPVPAIASDATTNDALRNGDETDARMDEIWKILDHTTMRVLDQCALYAEWTRYAEAKASVFGQDVSKPRGGRPKGGIARAARELPIRAKNEKAREKFIRRAIDIDSIWPEAKTAARVAGLDDIQSALLAIASEKSSPQAQLAKVQELASRKVAPRRKLGKANQTVMTNDAGQLTRLLDVSEVSGPDEQALFAQVRTLWTDDGVIQRADWQKASTRLRHRIATDIMGLGHSSPGDTEGHVSGSETSSASEPAIPSPPD